MDTDPLEMLKIISKQPGILRHDTDTISIMLKEIVVAWENERGSHEASIDILQDEIVKLNKQANELAEYHIDKMMKLNEMMENDKGG